MSENCVYMTLPAQASFVSVARLTVSGIASRMNFGVDQIEDIKVALSEACTNVIQHAYPEKSGVIEIEFRLFDDALEIQVSDTGQGFDTQNVKSKKPESPQTEPFGLGLGLVFIQSLMDKAEVFSEKGQGTTLTMVKRLAKSVS
jgi:serine/threonine-protein kinase RsbW